jgi:hypothetical protein
LQQRVIRRPKSQQQQQQRQLQQSDQATVEMALWFSTSPSGSPWRGPSEFLSDSPTQFSECDEKVRNLDCIAERSLSHAKDLLNLAVTLFFYWSHITANVASEDFEILCETLKMTGLDDFSTGSGPWTVFVQTDGAFHTLFGDHEELSMDVSTNLLAYHTVFDSEIYFDELIVNAFLLMYNGDKTLMLVHQWKVLENVWRRPLSHCLQFMVLIYILS